MKSIPSRGVSKQELLAQLESFRQNDVSWRDGRTWAYVYDPGPEANDVLKQAYSMYLSENGLDPTAFPSLLRMENEIIAMAVQHLKGDENTVGNFTSGGTESIILAVKTARDYSKARYPDIKQPEMILPITAHAAFHKAAHYLGVKKVLVDVDPVTFTADLDAVRRAITSRTILLVGSAISYAHGVVDPIRDMGEIALEHNLLFHVDGCMGGFLLPYFRRLGAPVPDFEFNVPGVTSISMDLHKYAFAAKGASVILYKNKELRLHQIYACSEWTGYTIVNPTVQSSKSGGPLAAAWAILQFIGDDGYLDMTRRMWEGTQQICNEIRKMKDLYLLGEPAMNLIAFASKTANVFHICDEMKTRGWFIQAQLGYGPSPANVHLSINPASLHHIDQMMRDLHESVKAAKALPSGDMAEGIKATFATLSPDDISNEVFEQMLGMAGIQGTALPGKMAEINEILDALPPKLRERLLSAFVNDLFHPI